MSKLCFANGYFLNLFQFHYGAIMSGHRPVPRPIQNRISIPLWCDYETHHAGSSSRFLYISIPLWCDYEEQSIARSYMVQLISIPLWCDYETHPIGSFSQFLYISIPLWCDYEFALKIRYIA